MQRKSNTSTRKRHKNHCSLPFSCPSPHNMDNVCRAGIPSQPTGFLIIECLSFTVHLITCKHHSLPHILLPLWTLSYNQATLNNVILCSAVLKKEKWLKENPKRVIPYIQRRQHDQVRYIQSVKCQQLANLQYSYCKLNYRLC